MRTNVFCHVVRIPMHYVNETVDTRRVDQAAVAETECRRWCVMAFENASSSLPTPPPPYGPDRQGILSRDYRLTDHSVMSPM